MTPRLLLPLLLLPMVVRAQTPTGKLDYNFHVRPILSDRCFICHGPDEKKRKADLRLDDRAAALEAGAIVPGKPDESPLVKRIADTGSDRMPPAKSNLHLNVEEIATLKRWIAEGAEYKPHWAFLPLPEKVGEGPLDRFVLDRLEREKLKPSPPASREDWLRRATFDLTGLPPTPGEMSAFVADRSPKAFETVVDRLLKSPRYGERMALEWLDVARYADSFGYQADGDTHVWPWRDWVIRACNDNLPFDRFLTWQIAGDLLPGATRDQKLATAFNRLHRMTNEGGSIPEEWRNEYVSDRVHTLGTAVLGLTLECCRCHDHKYDPIPTKDYYALAAFLNSIDEWGTYNNSHFRPAPTLLLPTPDQDAKLADLSRRVVALEEKDRGAVKSRESAFREWMKRSDRKPEVVGQIGSYSLDAIETNRHLSNAADEKHPGNTPAANGLVAGKHGKALQFSGDDPANFPNVGTFERGHSFGVGFWLWVPDPMKQGIVFHRTSGTDTGFNGTELTFDDGRLHFALVRFWPGNMLAVRTQLAVSPREWTHVAVGYDGSGRAAGVRLYLNGKPAEVEVVRDELTKNLEASGTGLTFGERFRSPGLKDGRIDEVRIFNRSLTPVEAAHLFDGKALADAIAGNDEAALRSYYFEAIDLEVATVRRELQTARRNLFDAQSGVFEIMTMRETVPRPAHILHRGDYDAPKNRPVGRDTPSALPPFPTDAPRDRLGLANWIAHPNHPLTARVAVNRMWQMFFGRGIVATTENFGQQGALPTHPELLDWLARQFVNGGWDVKALCKTIVLSSTYRQRSSAAPELRERDPENVLLARGPSRRLSAEMLRDAVLFAGGLLVERIGGPPAKPYQPPGLWRGQNAFLPEYVQDKGDGLYRRSLYTFWRRTSPPPNMLAFDAPSREVCIVRRQTTSTPLQPLVLLNDPQFVEAGRGLGERMLREGGTTVGERVTFAFRAACSRSPTERERALLERLYERQRDAFAVAPDGAKKYLRTGERSAAKDLDAVELATAAVVANAVLNLDAAVMVR